MCTLPKTEKLVIAGDIDVVVSSHEFYPGDPGSNLVNIALCVAEHRCENQYRQVFQSNTHQDMMAPIS